MIKGLRERKYSALLAALVLAAVVEPLSASWGEAPQIVGGMIVAVINLGVFLAVFEHRWHRRVAFFMVVLLFASNIMHEVLSDRSQMGSIVYHCFAAVFLAYAVALILKRIFRQDTIRTDDVIGALCGYLLAAAAWGNAYALTYQLSPGSFRVADAIAWQLGDWHLQRFFFGYFSVMTLTGLGYGHIIPMGPPAYSLSWLESVFGQFYIAVVVAQLVGLRLAESIKRDRGD